MFLVGGFFDESTDEDSGGLCYTVAGFIGNQLVTGILELRWRALLEKYELDYFKASELNAGTGQFQKFRDKPDRREWRPFSDREKQLFQTIKTDFTDCIIGVGDGLYGIGAVVILPDLERLRAEHENAKALPLPYFICSNMVLVEAGTEMLNANRGHKTNLCWLRPIFDSHEQYGGLAKKSWDMFCSRNPKSEKYLLPPHYEREQEYLTLQAADNLAFEVRKFIFTEQQQRPPRIPIRRMFANRNILKVYKFDYESLKMVADAQFGIYTDAIKKGLAAIERPLSDLRDTITETDHEAKQPRIRELRQNNAAVNQRSTQRNQGGTRSGKNRKKEKTEG